MTIESNKYLALKTWLLAGLFVLACPSFGEQKVTHGDYDIHYIVFPTLDLNQDIADKYGLPRGKNRALVNISVLRNTHTDGQSTQIDAVSAQISGRSVNLLGQSQTLKFSEVKEGPAIYYLALLRHADEEFQRVSIDVMLPDGTLAQLRFQQQMYWER